MSAGDRWHAITCPLRTRWRRWRYHQPLWRLDKTAQVLGVSFYGCANCGRGAIAERDTRPVSAGDRDTLAALLAEHWSARWMPEGHECRCGQIVGSRLESTEDALSAHLDDVIASSDWLREQRAEAWNEGLGVGSGMARIYGHTDHWPDIEPTNPYRTTEDTESSQNG